MLYEIIIESDLPLGDKLVFITGGHVWYEKEAWNREEIWTMKY